MNRSRARLKHALSVIVLTIAALLGYNLDFPGWPGNNTAMDRDGTPVLGETPVL